MKRRYLPILTSLLVLAGSLQAQAPLRPGRTLWRICLSRSTPTPIDSTCGSLQFLSTERVAHFRFTLDLDRLLGKNGYRQFDTGASVFATDDSVLSVQFPLPPTVIVSGDDGAIVATLRLGVGGYRGTWSRNCFGDCPDSGVVWLVPPQARAP